jgi:hypothetical protein
MAIDLYNAPIIAQHDVAIHSRASEQKIAQNVWMFTPNTQSAHGVGKADAAAWFDWADIAASPQMSGSVDQLMAQMSRGLSGALQTALPKALQSAGMNAAGSSALAEALSKVLVEQFKPGKDVKPADGREPTLVLGVIPPGEQVAAFGNATRSVVFCNAARPLLT